MVEISIIPCLHLPLLSTIKLNFFLFVNCIKTCMCLKVTANFGKAVGNIWHEMALARVHGHREDCVKRCDCDDCHCCHAHNADCQLDDCVLKRLNAKAPAMSGQARSCQVYSCQFKYRALFSQV